ncbi:MAG TPA: glycoside hydrolase family 3 N-terminal domain-containing protein [Humidesulfovibrio sp.]|uniref:glycoside hydrolase family 3 protein n=1 Tax=Humidesulfovibrio sp. TaxID=2910988 RepID=UPI002C7537F8|nr:glycoside hydrolase family 3 N-terminal domain-containing protein [Humidesulfovibrio sp.]HWR03977.1 glycoside hydrolase family 3 N-terminal domain-containing protein [Humidesulfovibrio sp.]
MTGPKSVRMQARALVRGLTLLCLGLALSGCALLREAPTPELKRQAGQMLLVGFRGAEPLDEQGRPLPILGQIPRLNLGGVILFDRDAQLGTPGRNVANPEQLKRLNAALSKAAANASQPPLFVAVDQEGGRVQRLKPVNGFPDGPAAADLCPADDAQAELARTAGTATGRMLREAGFNLDFAPVCDVNVNPENPVIGGIGRSFSADPKRVADCAGAFAQGLQSQGVLTAAKHFPGHGSSASDSHLGFTDVSATWSEAELSPFAALIQSGRADMIMTAHVFNDRLDARHPATLSRPVITGLLRRKLGFTGVVVTDDLQMRAITSKYGLKEALGLAVNAGADLLLIGNNLAYEEDAPDKAISALMELVAEGTVSPARIRESAGRIAALKVKIQTQSQR